MIALKIYLFVGTLLAIFMARALKPVFRDATDFVAFMIAMVSFVLAYPVFFIWGARRP